MINKTLKKNPNTSILFCLISINKLSSYHHGFKSNTRGKNEIKKKQITCVSLGTYGP